MRIKFLLLTILTLNISCNMSQKKDNSTMFALIDTNKGTIKTELYFQQTPVTVANFVSLSEGSNKEVSDEYKNKKYYNGITFHRVISDFMIQGGDPTGTGSGSPTQTSSTILTSCQTVPRLSTRSEMVRKLRTTPTGADFPPAGQSD